MTKVPPIQAQLNSMREKGGGSVFIYPGEHHIERPLHVYSGTILFLFGDAKIIAEHSGPAIINAGRGSVPSTGYSLYGAHGNISICGGVITRTEPSEEPIVLLRNTSRVILQETIFEGMPGDFLAPVVDISACERVRMRDCTVLGGVVRVGPQPPVMVAGKWTAPKVPTRSQNVILSGNTLDHEPIWVDMQDSSQAFSKENFRAA